MRLGDLDALKKCAIPCEIHNGALTDLCVPLYQIDNAPTVEVMPTELHEKIMDKTTGELLECQSNLRPQGEWISGKDSCACYWFCSECKMSIPKDTDYQYHFCPKCGADMRGKEE